MTPPSRSQLWSASSSTVATTAAKTIARGSKRSDERSFPEHGRDGRREGRRRRPVAQRAPVDDHLHDAEEDRPGDLPEQREDDRRGPALGDDPEPARQRLERVDVLVDAAEHDPDEDREHERVVDEPQHAGRRGTRSRRLAPRACSRPIIGAVIAWVSGAFTRAGPITATVWRIAASEAPWPARAPPVYAARASEIPPPRAKKNCSDGAARLARNETVATWARPIIRLQCGARRARASRGARPARLQENAGRARNGGRWFSHPTRGAFQ